MESSTTSITKFVIQGKTLYVKVYWKENDVDLFHIKVYDGNNCWTGRYSNVFAAKYRDIVEESEEEYNRNVKIGLGLTKSSRDKFVQVFSVNPNEPDSATFTWKKKLEESGVLIHGSVPVHLEYNKDTRNDLIDFLLQENQDLKQIAEEYEMKVQVLNTEIEQCKEGLEKFVNLKTSLEMSVYGKFVQLLNSKKERLKLIDQQTYEDQGDGNAADNELD